jgi:hypothetical protein
MIEKKRAKEEADLERELDEGDGKSVQPQASE